MEIRKQILKQRPEMNTQPEGESRGGTRSAMENLACRWLHNKVNHQTPKPYERSADWRRVER